MALVVTGLYDLQSKENNSERRPVSDYTKYVDYLLTIEKDVVVFTEESLKPELEPLFTSCPNIRLVVLPFEQFEYIHCADTLKANALKNPFKTDSPYKTTVSYTILMWNKFFLVNKARELFPTYYKYVWMDFGLGFVVQKNPCDINKVLDKFDADHFSCTIINPMARHEFDSLEESFGSWKYRQVGGFWSLGKNCFDFFIQFVREQIEFILASERICADEEIMARFSCLHPDKCVFSFGDYASCVCNWIALTHDLTVAVTAINKSHIHGLHHMACQGAAKMLNTYNQGFISIEKPNLIRFMFMYYIEAFYTNKQLARQVAIHFLLCAHVDPEFARFFNEKRNELKDQLQFVMSAHEFSEWGPPAATSESIDSYHVFKKLIR